MNLLAFALLHLVTHRKALFWISKNKLKRRIFEVFCIQMCWFHYDSKPNFVAAVDFLVDSFLFFASFFDRRKWNLEIVVEIAPEPLILAIN